MTVFAKLSTYIVKSHVLRDERQGLIVAPLPTCELTAAGVGEVSASENKRNETGLQSLKKNAVLLRANFKELKK